MLRSPRSLLALACALGVLFGSSWLSVRLLRAENQSASHALDTARVVEQINRHISLRQQAIATVARNGYVRGLLLGEIAPDAPDIRLVLETANQVAQSELIWIMNRQGVVESSTEWLGGTLIGTDYSFRPYFQQSMAGREAVFPAVGARTLTRGFYLSAPVFGDDPIPLGVAALKISAQEMDSLLQVQDDIMAVVSPEGVVFSSNRHGWIFHTVRPLDAEVFALFAETRQYGDQDLEPLAWSLTGDRTQIDGVAYSVSRAPMSIPGWEIVSCQPIRADFPLTPLQKKMLTLTIMVVSGLFLLIFVLVRTIRMRQKSEAALRSSEARYRSLVDNALEGVFQSSLDGKLLSANPAMAQILGYDSPEDIMGHLHDISRDLYVRPEDREFFVRRLREEGQVTDFEVQVKKKDGTRAWGLVSARALTDGAGRLERLEGLCIDITARKLAEEHQAELNQRLERTVAERTAELTERTRQLEVANKRLFELDAVKSAFLSSVSHELRTPLTSLLGFAKLIERDFRRHFAPSGNDDPESASMAARIFDNLHIIAAEGERLTRLINDVLDVNRIESGKMQWNDRDVNVGEIVERAARSISGMVLRAQQLELVVEADPNLPVLHMDPDRLHQVVLNLLSNAVKFTNRGTILLAVHQTGDNLEITVSDTGCGIAPEELGHIFESFRQAHGGDTRDGRPPGTGLGLTICRQIVEHYGGTITVESVVGKGSVFQVLLPV